jgi:hypothetical protein
MPDKYAWYIGKGNTHFTPYNIGRLSRKAGSKSREQAADDQVYHFHKMPSDSDGKTVPQFYMIPVSLKSLPDCIKGNKIIFNNYHCLIWRIGLWRAQYQKLCL